MVATGNQQAGELERHREAYILLFESLLKKRVQDQKIYQTRLSELKQIVDGIDSTDAFIDRIADFARIVQLSDEQLGGYIGQNFLRALSLVQEKQKQPAPRRAGPADAFAHDGPLLETLLSTFGPLVTPPDHFEPLESGAIKLIKGGRDILPASGMGLAGDAAESNTASADAATESAASDAAAEALKLREEKSVIAEILEQFGNILEIHQALVPRDFTGDAEAFVVEEAAAPTEERAEPIRETSIIEEILQRFGNDLQVHERLEPAEFSGDDDFFDHNEETHEDTMDEEDASPDSIGVTLTAFAAIRSRINEFQKNQDRAGYQNFLGTASDDIKAVVALLNLASKQKRQQIDMDDELNRLSGSLPYSAAQLKELSVRMERYSRVTAIVNEFTAKVKQASAPVQMEMRKVWKQVLDLVDEDPGETVVKQRAKILLLAVNPSVKPSIESGIMSLIEKIYSL